MLPQGLVGPSQRTVRNLAINLRKLINEALPLLSNLGDGSNGSRAAGVFMESALRRYSGA
jgi:hypothetical protein